MEPKPQPFPLPAIPPKFSSSQTPSEQSKYASKVYADFFVFPISKARKILETTSGEEWEKQGQKKALQVFHAAAERVPAYKDFLKKHKIKHEKIKTITDFQQVPWISKNSYLKKYPIEDLCWEGDFHRSQIVSVSSGSTGKPFLWPRDMRLELETTYFFELILHSFFNISERKTLVVNCFAMGMYVGGPFFLNATLRIAQKGHSVTVVTPGNMIDDVLRVIQELASNYEQVILSGYPPFLKDVIENGTDIGINWSQYRTVLFPAGEGFSEGWRTAVAQSAGGTNTAVDFLSYYGTADAAVLGFETPWSVFFRQAVASENGTVEQVFGQCRLPSLMQYFPTLRYFEVNKNELHFTAANGSIPLIRYNIGDNGGLLTHDQITSIAEKNNIDIRSKLAKCGHTKLWQLPYVYVFGRTDHTVVLYGANIYPENIKTALETGSLSSKCTGRFTMEVEEDHDHNQHLNIHIECQRVAKPTNHLRKQITKTIILVLEEANSEYTNASKAIGGRAIPCIFLHRYGDEHYFPRDKKQKWKS